MTPEQEREELLLKVKETSEKVIKDSQNKFEADKKEIKDQITAIKSQLENIKDNEQIKTVIEELSALNLKVKSLTEQKQIKDNSNFGRIKSWIENNKNAIETIKKGQKADLTPLVIKVASPMTPANTLNGSAYVPSVEIEAGINENVRVQPTFWDKLRKGRTSSAAYTWVNKKNPLGAAGFIGPGVLKPNISFEIATEISNAKKIAVSEKCSTELLEDVDGMASWINQELEYQLKAKMNTTLMSGVASSTVPAGIQTLSTTFTLSGIATTNPNRWDAIRACVAQLRSGNLSGSVTAFVNPVDYANMVLTKAQSQGQLFMPAETGAEIVEDNNIPVGYVQIALLDYYRVLIYKDLAITFGLDGNDFTFNLITGIAEMRIHQFMSENHTGAFIYDTFENIIDAITPAP